MQFVNTTGHDIYIPVVKLSGATMLVTLSGGKRLGKTEYLMDPNFSTPRGVPYPDGVLPPHATATLYFDAISTTLVSQAVLSVHVKVLDSTESTPVNWTTELAGDRPANITDASWTTIVHDVATVFGATDGSYATTLAGMMNQAATDGVTFTTESQALDWALQQVMAEGAGASVSGTLYKGNTTTPFGRTTLELVSADGSQVDTATTWYGGQFNFWGVPAGTYHLVVPGFEPPSNGTFTVPPTGIGHHLNVVALPGATVQGTITDGTTSKPVAGATVSVTETGGSTSSAPTGANGTYTLSGVVPGPVTLVASGPGVVTSTPVHLTVSTSAPTTQNFALSGGGSISGKVQATHGGPPPTGTTVSAIPGSPSAAPVSGAVKSDGTFTISGLQAGTYTVEARVGKTQIALSAPVAVSVGVTTTGVTLTLGSTVTVSGTVEATGTPISGALVRSTGPGKSSPVTTASDGSYTLSGLAAGTQTLVVTTPHGTHPPDLATIAPSSGQSLTKNFTLAAYGSITVTVRSTLGAAIPGAAVLLIPADPGQDPRQLAPTSRCDRRHRDRDVQHNRSGGLRRQCPRQHNRRTPRRDAGPSEGHCHIDSARGDGGRDRSRSPWQPPGRRSGPGRQRFRTGRHHPDDSQRDLQPPAHLTRHVHGGSL